MSPVLIFAIIVVFVIILLTVYLLQPEPEKPWVRRKPHPTFVAKSNTYDDDNMFTYKVGHLVKYEWSLPTTTTDLCARDDFSSRAIAIGTVTSNTDGNIHVKWDRIINPNHRDGMSPSDCCWSRSKVDDTFVRNHFGHSIAPPAINNGLKVDFTTIEASDMLSRQITTPTCPSAPMDFGKKYEYSDV
jgi:hypothetical protein